MGEFGDDNVTRLERTDLKRIMVVAQALDNQWVPKHLLARMAQRGASRRSRIRTLAPFVRTEYLRALINAEQVVINRTNLAMK